MHYMSTMKEKIVYVIQEIPGTKEGRPKINILGASEYGTFKFLLPELSQIIFSIENGEGIPIEYFSGE